MTITVERKEQMIRTPGGDYFLSIFTRWQAGESLIQEHETGFVDSETAGKWIEARKIQDGLARLAKGERLVWEGRMSIEEEGEDEPEVEERHSVS